MKRIHFLSILLFSCFCCQLFGQTVNASMLEQLEKAEKEMFAATSNGDTAAFRSISSPAYLTINADGVTQTLEEALVNMARFKGATHLLSEQKSRVFGNVALRTGRAKFFVGQQQVAEILYTSGWIFENNAWHFMHWQGTPSGIMPGKDPSKN